MHCNFEREQCPDWKLRCPFLLVAMFLRVLTIVSPTMWPWVSKEHSFREVEKEASPRTHDDEGNEAARGR
eukprot:2449001-Amphidinium_carterae.1